MKKISDSVYQQLAVTFRTTEGQYTNAFPEEALRIIREHRLFKLFLPETLGGAGYSLTETLEVIQRCAYINGSLGWLVQIGNGGNYFAAFMEEQTARKLFAPVNAVLAGSGSPNKATARAEEGGYNVSGTWNYASGSAYASFFTFSAKVEGSDEIISGVLMPEQVSVTDDWKTIGMQQTTTNTFTAEEQFVPQEFIFGLTELKWLRDVPVFRFPFFPFAQSFFLNVQYGLLKHICTEATTIAHANLQRWKAQYPLRATTILAAVAKAQSQLKQSESELIGLVHTVEQAASLSEQLLKEFDSCAKRQAAEIMSTAHSLFVLLGMEVLYEAHPLNVAYRDMMVCGQHSLLHDYRSISPLPD